ncbi:uncharacterized protein LOC119670628 [Teleopsis dalmanni]|uniref:uncharacterized protein LOC119670628 n=1 Tax=Teleopsis dalmanni TaxID=139649 RepID=UPI0018CD7B70|nr:uncharacterized protein LOC119670628 [Teleopsis dalmanni]
MANYQVSRPPEKKAAYRFRIVVTHYINPQLFWYYIDVPDSLHKVLEVESLLLAECTRDSGQCYFRPHLNEIVAVQYLPFSKYIRGQVLHVDNESEKPTYILWAIDHGFPFASDGRYLWQIPVELRKPTDRIICGGMANIYPKPSVPITDDVNVHHIISEMSWSDDACEFIEWLMKNARYLFFYHLHLSENRKQWGFLNIRFQNGSEYKASQLLNDYEFSIPAEDDFRVESTYLKYLNHCPWLSNSGKTIYRLNKIESIPKLSSIQDRLRINCQASTNISPRLQQIFDELKDKPNGITINTNIVNNMTENKDDDKEVQKYRDLRSRLNFGRNNDYHKMQRHKNFNRYHPNKMKTQVDDENESIFDNKFSNFHDSKDKFFTNDLDDLPKVRPARKRIAAKEVLDSEHDVKTRVSNIVNTEESNEAGMSLTSKVMQFLADNKNRLFSNIELDKTKIMNLNISGHNKPINNPLALPTNREKTSENIYCPMNKRPKFVAEDETETQHGLKKQNFRFNNKESLTDMAKLFLSRKENIDQETNISQQRIASTPVECTKKVDNPSMKQYFSKIDKLLAEEHMMTANQKHVLGFNRSKINNRLVNNMEKPAILKRELDIPENEKTFDMKKQKIRFLDECLKIENYDEIYNKHDYGSENENLINVNTTTILAEVHKGVNEGKYAVERKLNKISCHEEIKVQRNSKDVIQSSAEVVNVITEEQPVSSKVTHIFPTTARSSSSEKVNIINEEQPVSSNSEIMNIIKKVKPALNKEAHVNPTPAKSSTGEIVNIVKKEQPVSSKNTQVDPTAAKSSDSEIMNVIKKVQPVPNSDAHVNPTSAKSSAGEIINIVKEEQPVSSKITQMDLIATKSSDSEIMNVIKKVQPVPNKNTQVDPTAAKSSDSEIINVIKKVQPVPDKDTHVYPISAKSSASEIVNIVKEEKPVTNSYAHIDPTAAKSSAGEIVNLIKEKNVSNVQPTSITSLEKPSNLFQPSTLKGILNSFLEKHNYLTNINTNTTANKEKLFQPKDEENKQQQVVLAKNTVQYENLKSIDANDCRKNMTEEELQLYEKKRLELKIKHNKVLMTIPGIQEVCWQQRLQLMSDVWSEEDEGEIEIHIKVLDYNKVNKRDIDNCTLFDDGIAHIESFLKKADEDYCLISEELNEHVKQLIKTNEDEMNIKGQTNIRSLLGGNHIECAEELPLVLTEADRKQAVFQSFEQRNAIDPLIEYKNKLNIRQLYFETTFNDNVVLKTKEPILVHSKNSYLPIHNLKYYELYEPILDKLSHLHITDLKMLQAYAWPHLLRGNSMCLLGEENSGKTLCYLPIVCHLIAMRKQHYYIPQSFGPVAIVLLHEQYQIKPVQELCTDMLKSTKSRIISSLGIRNFDQTQFQLLSGCEILLITPSSLKFLLTHDEVGSLIDSQRLMHLVIDDMDKIIAQSKDDLEYVLRRLIKIGKPQLLQVIVTSSTWEKILSSMLRQFKDMALLIGDFAEATFYANTDIKLKLSASAHKLQLLSDIMNAHTYKKERTLILCNSPQDVLQVVEFLKNNGHPYINFEEDSSKENYSKFYKLAGYETTAACLVSTDNNIYKILQTPDLQNIIHYSLPATWTSFARRFATMANNIHNFVVKGLNDLPITAGTKSMILLDEGNHTVFRTLIDLMKRRSVTNIHRNIIAVADKIWEENEIQKVCSQKTLCRYLLGFGECIKLRCEYRHRLASYDQPKDEELIPSFGDMRVKIIKVISPSHFLARPLGYRVNKSEAFQQIRKSNEMSLFEMNLNFHYLNEDNLIVLSSPAIGDLCIYKITEMPYRAKIIDVGHNKDPDADTSLKFTLKLIDVGTIVSTVNPNLIYVCDEQFKYFPAQAIDIHLLGVIPCYNERHWEHSIKEVLHDLLIAKFESTQCVHIKINFAVGNYIWVDAINIYEDLKSINIWSLKHCIKKILFDEKYAVFSSEVAINLREFARDFINEKQNKTVIIEDEEHQLKEDVNVEKSEELIESQNVLNELEEFDINEESTDDWTSIPLDQVLPIKLGYFDDWPTIFVQIINDENESMLKLLQEKIDQYIEQIKCDTIYELPEHLLSPRTNCIVRHDEKYSRAKFYGTDRHNGLKGFWFLLCDYGEFINVDKNVLKTEFLYETTAELLNFAPYQAIQCQVNNYEQSYSFWGKQIYYIKATKCLTDNNFNMKTYNVNISQSDDMDEEVFWEEDDDFAPFYWMEENYVDRPEEDNRNSKFVSGSNLIKSMVKFSAATNLDSMNRAFKDVVVIEAESVNNKPRFKVEIIELTDTLTDTPTTVPIELEDLSVLNNNIPTQTAQLEYQFSDLPELKQLYECPPTTWYQSNFIISLKIYVPDIQTYNLKVTDEMLIFAAKINEKKNVVILNFLGLVEPERVVHELRGLYVYVKLLKRVHMMWPRLLREGKFNNFVKCDPNIFEEIEQKPIEVRPLIMSVCDDDSDHELEKYDDVKTLSESEDEY